MAKKFLKKEVAEKVLERSKDPENKTKRRSVAEVREAMYGKKK